MISQWVIFHGRLLNDPRVYTIHRGQHLATGGHVPVMHQRCGRKAGPHDVFAHSFFRPCVFFFKSLSVSLWISQAIHHSEFLSRKNNASWAATPTRGAFKVVRNLFQMLDLNRLSLQEICLDSVCSLHFPLNFSWILIPQKSYCFGSDPEQGHQTQKIFQLLISHPSSDGNKNWFEGPINPQLITLDRPHIW